MIVGIKYCGGCNPRFDRTALVDHLRRAFPVLTFVGAAELGAEKADFVVVVCGCPAACAAHEGLEGSRGKQIVTSAEEYAAVERRIASLLPPAFS